MKVVSISYSGSVGKTTCAANLLRPNMADAEIYSVESINDSMDGLGVDSLKFVGKRFGELYRNLMVVDDAIVDVGASNVEPFLEAMLNFDNSYEEFDYFVVPVIPNIKDQKDTISTIEALHSIGVDKDRIRLVFNRVEDLSSIDSDFQLVVNYHLAQGTFRLNRDAAIQESDLFNQLSTYQTTVQAILEDQTDYRAEMRKVDRASRKFMELSDKALMQRQAIKVDRELKAVYYALFAD